GRPLALGWEDVVPGIYEPETDSFVASWDGTKVNALRIDASVSQIETYFAPAAFGVHYLGARKVGMATTGTGSGAGSVPCYLPLAIPDCFFTDVPVDQAEALELRLNSSVNDNAGWALLDRSPSASSLSSHLRDTCRAGEAQVGDDVYLNNGVITSALSTLQD